jgi:nucleoid DNA-binding protein
MERNREEIIYHLANKYGLTIKQVEDIVNSQFKFTAKIIKRGNFDTIRLPYLGKFTVDKNRVKHINNLKNEKNIKDI